MEELFISRERIREIFRNIEPYFKEKLGKYTHQRISGDWNFHGLGFVNGNMTYVFGINIGFFKVGSKSNYSHVGMNVLVRTNGVNSGLRLKYCDFFREHLKQWISNKEMVYTSERGGVGSEFPKYKLISSFKNDNEILTFLKSCIDGVNSIYPEIAKNVDNLFDNVLRAAPPWHDKLVDITKKHSTIN